MAVTVTPETFALVFFDAGEIRRIADALLQRLEMSDLDVRIEIDETTPIARISAEPGPPIVVRAESGAFEDTRKPRHMSETSIATSLARVLMRVKDRSSAGFADAPPDDDLTLPQVAAWDTYCVGRYGRMGYSVHQPRWRYNFRNRHGFTDVADAAFEQLWAADDLTWEGLMTISEDARAHGPTV